MPGTTQPPAPPPVSLAVPATPGAPGAPVAAGVPDRLVRVRADLARAERHLRRARRRDAAGVVVALSSTSLSTVVAGSAVAVGHAVGTPSWRVTCGIAAVLSALAAIATGLRQSFSSGERLARAASCVGRLRGLEFGLAVGGVSAEMADQQYRELIEQYSEIIAEA
jgi:hypothetical protein